MWKGENITENEKSAGMRNFAEHERLCLKKETSSEKEREFYNIRENFRLRERISE